MDCKLHRWRGGGQWQAGGLVVVEELEVGTGTDMVQISEGATVRPGARRFSLHGHYDLQSARSLMHLYDNLVGYEVKMYPAYS